MPNRLSRVDHIDCRQYKIARYSGIIRALNSKLQTSNPSTSPPYYIPSVLVCVAALGEKLPLFKLPIHHDHHHPKEKRKKKARKQKWSSTGSTKPAPTSPANSPSPSSPPSSTPPSPACPTASTSTTGPASSACHNSNTTSASSTQHFKPGKSPLRGNLSGRGLRRRESRVERFWRGIWGIGGAELGRFGRRRGLGWWGF